MRLLILALGMLWAGLGLAQTSATLNANAGPSDNGTSVGAALLFDLEAATDLVVTGLTTASTVAPGSTYQVTVYSRPGTALGGPVNTGPGSSLDGWTNLGSYTVTQGAGEISLPIHITPVAIGAGQVVGMAVRFQPGTTARYVGTGTPPIQTFSNANLTLRSGDVRSVPFTTGGDFFSSRTLVGSVLYRPASPVMPANVGPTNNFGLVDSGMFFNLQSNTGAVLEGLSTATEATPGTSFEIDVYTRSGTALGNVFGSGPATSTAGWQFRGTVPAVQAVGENTLPLNLPSIGVPPGQTVGVGLVYRGVQPAYFGIGSPPFETYGNATLTLTTGDALAVPFSAVSEVFSSRALVGSLVWRPMGQQLPAHPGPSDNGNNAGTGQFLDVVGPSDAVIRGFRVASSAPADSTFQVQVFTRNGTALGGTLASGPGSSSAGWTLHTTATVTQAATGELSLPFIVPDISLTAGQTRGIALVFVDAGPNYRGSGSGSVGSFEASGVQITTGEARTVPFTSTGNLFNGRQLVGTVYIRRPDAMFRNGFE